MPTVTTDREEGLRTPAGRLDLGPFVLPCGNQGFGSALLEVDRLLQRLKILVLPYVGGVDRSEHYVGDP
ncbi:hypothetical protein ACFFX0_32260 [Citricoccus parietis]|uniref:Uncharacterized protein n=1 Tax=Citricoccus parietis TaxID=592307 RepID=A0ABV5G9I2_9MICC